MASIVLLAKPLWENSYAPGDRCTTCHWVTCPITNWLFQFAWLFSMKNTTTWQSQACMTRVEAPHARPRYSSDKTIRFFYNFCSGREWPLWAFQRTLLDYSEVFCSVTRQFAWSWAPRIRKSSTNPVKLLVHCIGRWYEVTNHVASMLWYGHLSRLNDVTGVLNANEEEITLLQFDSDGGFEQYD